jgi:hypothetical protein
MKQHHTNAGTDGTHGAERVHQYMGQRGADVDALPLTHHQESGNAEVDEKPEDCNHEHHPSDNGPRVIEPLYRFDNDRKRGHRQEHAVDERGKHLGAPPPKRRALRPRPCGPTLRPQRKPKGTAISQHVPGICEQSEAAGPPPHDGLNGQKPKRYEKRDTEDAHGHVHGVSMIVLVVVLVVVMTRP